MKTKTWVILLAAVLIICAGLSLWLLRPGKAAQAEIWSEGKHLYTLDLAVDRVITVTSENGTNVVTIQNGEIAVTEADCPDGYCMDRGFCGGGAQIVCLPNRLVIRFVGEQSIDAVVG